SGQRDRGRPVAEEPSATRERERLAAVVEATLSETEPLETVETRAVERLRDAGEPQRLVEPEAEHHSLPRLHVDRQSLDLARRPLSATDRPDVRCETRRVPPPPPADGGHRADPEPEVVAAAPVREVVPRTQVTPARALR